MAERNLRFGDAVSREETTKYVAGKCRPDTAAASRILKVSGWLLVFAGLIHVAVWLASGQPWEGSISWRKPALFGVSGGFTLVSLGFLYRMLAPKRWDTWLAGSLGTAMCLEVALISIQQWRGVKSHFNRSTTFDSFIDTAITGLIILVTGCIVVLSVRAMSFLNANSDKRIAWRGGLFFLLISCAIGFMIYAYGAFQTSRGADPTLFGKAGVVKFPHGMAIHAIQLLPGLCWLMTRLTIPLATRAAALRFANMALACLLSYSVVQTLSGRARSDLTVLSACILVAATAFAAPLMIAIVRGMANKFASKSLVLPRDAP